MGESVVERPTFENKMGDSVPSAASPLQVSISFGRFDTDSLSWEKWSSFSPNKYLEEVEKCSTPGSVAQKKAYFEAHYKKIAARKIEQLEQEKSMESDPPNSDESKCKDAVKKRSLANGEDCSPVNGRSAEGVESDVAAGLNMTPIEEENEHDSISVDSQDISVEVGKEELNVTSDNHELDIIETSKEESASNQAEVELSSGEEATVVQDDISEKKSLEIVEQPLKVDGEVKKTPLRDKKSPKLHPGNITKKTTRVEQKVAGTKNKVVAPATKSSMVSKMPQLSTPRVSKSTIMPASRTSTKKVNGSLSMPMAKNSPGQNRRAMPTSLHMSLSLDPASSGPSLPTTRKSLIMESMGDKDIVKRAFKTFQKSLNGLRSSNDGITSTPQPVSMKGSEKKVTPDLTPRKENEGLRKSAEKIIQRGRSGNTSNSLSSQSFKVSGIDKKYATVVSSSTSVRTDARAETWKEKPGEKSFVRETEGSHHSAKSKEGQMKNVRQGVKPRASGTPSFNRGLGTTRITPEKEDKILKYEWLRVTQEMIEPESPFRAEAKIYVGPLCLDAPVLTDN